MQAHGEAGPKILSDLEQGKKQQPVLNLRHGLGQGWERHPIAVTVVDSGKRTIQGWGEV
jgi:hypothetical protein